MQKKNIWGGMASYYKENGEDVCMYEKVTVPWLSRYNTVEKIHQQQKKLNSNKKKHETKNRINIINYGNKFWFIFSAFIFLFFFSCIQSKKKWRILPLTTFNVEVWAVTKWSITLLFFFLIVYAKQVRCNATCVTFAYYIINLMNGLCQRTLCRSRSLLH